MKFSPSTPSTTSNSHPRHWSGKILRRFRYLILLQLLGIFASRSHAQQFQEVTSTVQFADELKKSWGNPVWADMNNDGFLDIIVPCHGLASSHGPMVYLNNAGATFTDVRTTCQIKMGPELDSRDWHGFSFGDYDNDGNLDLYIAEGSKKGITPKRDLLYHGQGNGVFDYYSDTAGMVTSTDRGRCGFWIDYDNDGYLDLFVKNYGATNRLYHNNHDGTFTDVAAAAGIADATLGVDYGTVVSFADYDNDGYMDVFFSGDNTSDVLYHNNRNGTFSDVTAAAGIKSLNTGHGIAWGDYNNDGYLDLYVVRGHLGGTGMTGATLYRNNGNGTFTDVTSAAGLTITDNVWAAVWGDYDNDGNLDLFVTNAGVDASGPGNHNFVFHNNGNGTFTDVANTVGLALQDNTSLHKGAAWGDYDNDGFLDLLLKDGIGGEKDTGSAAMGYHRLFRNSGNTNHYIKVVLQGVQSNREGIGARVSAAYNGTTIYRQNNGGGGGEYASEGAEPIHFGIGQAATADVTIKWPSGTVDLVTGVAANSTLKVVEGSGNATPTPTPTPSAPVITRQPRNRMANVGDRVNFAVEATGAAPLTYQWRKNDVNIDGATDVHYKTPPVTIGDNGSTYSVVVTNPGGSTPSREAQLSVSPSKP